MPKDLTTLEKNFCEEYVNNGGNATSAIKKARGKPYQSENTAYSAAARMHKKVKVQEYIHFLNAKATDNTIMTRKEVLQRLTNLGRASLRAVVKWDADGVKLKSSEDLTDAEAETVQEVSESKGKTDSMKIKQYDKIKALELLAKHHGALEGGKGSGSEDDQGDRADLKTSISKSIGKLRK